ncbi:MAG: hypothetical protein R3D58_19595 [Saprospiraceae bacterium]
MRIATTVICLILAAVGYGQDADEIERLFNNGDFEAVVEKGTRLLEADTDELIVCHLVGRALTELKQFEQAKPLLKKTTVKSAPGWMKSWSFGYLGICNYATGNLKESESNFKKAVKLNATKNSTKFAARRLKLLQLPEYAKDWETIETDNIRFYVQPGHQIADLKKYCSERNAAFIENNHFFNAAPYKKIDFFVWSNPEEGKKILGEEIGFANSDFCMINAKINQTKGHEITHILCDYGIKPNKKNRLINEGVAVAFDLTNRNRVELAKSANQKNMKIKDFFNESSRLPEDIIYPVGGALIEYLRTKNDNERLKRLLKEQTYEALLETYGIEIIEEFERKIMF